SGGLDSSVLLHCIVDLGHRDPERAPVPVLAIHVDHGLHDDSAAWSEHCAAFAQQHGIDFRTLRVDVDRQSGTGLEAAARDARYAALRDELQCDDWLISAHHQEDQAETMLLNLVRGSGPAGIAGIGAVRPLGPGTLVRPLLGVSQAALRDYATAKSLHWLVDPSNTDRRFDRNFLRHEILPALQTRWPDIAERLQRSASHASEASELLTELARIDLRAIGGRPRRLDIDGLNSLSLARRKNLIRFALSELGLTTPSTQMLDRVINEVIPARIDAQPNVVWPGGSIRRYRNALYLLPEKLADCIVTSPLSLDELPLGPGMGRLVLQGGAAIGLSETLVRAGLTVKKRRGGEEIKLQGQAHTRKLKKLLQEEGILPWMRDRLPLVFAGERLVAVADLWLAADALSEPGYALRWIDRPALH
ncbi:MAG TPA: tRNA lysidine(34) synthetase TilS, partial [Woeseiaceae bacterium]|nr:tRNA lysidine(34) synthetase TilS [Woeseiaceae bacterium]